MDGQAAPAVFAGQRIFGDYTYAEFRAECSQTDYDSPSAKAWWARLRDLPADAPERKGPTPKLLGEGFPREDEVLYLWAQEESYEGSAYILWMRDGQLYENDLSHCSCNGYGEDWASWGTDAQKVTPAYLAKRGLPHQHSISDALRPAAAVAWDWVLTHYA